MPKDEPPELNVRVNLMISEQLKEAIDKWRAQTPGLPNRSEAIRRLVEAGLEAGPE